MNPNITGEQTAAEIIHILLVDNNADDEHFIRTTLAEASAKPSVKIKFELTRIEKLEPEWAQTTPQRFDAILLDLTSFNGSGMTNLARVHTLLPGVPMIVLAATDDHTVVQQVLQKGAQEFLAKTQLDATTLAHAIDYAITRQQAVQALSDNKDHLENVLRNAAEALISVDEEQRIVFFNQAAEQIFGYQADEVMDKPLDLLIPERFMSSHRQHIREFAQEPVNVRRMAHRREIFGRHKDGTEFPVSAGISKFSRNGKMVFTVIVEDVTERQQAESSRALLAAIIESTDDAILSKDLSGIIQTWNHGAEKLYGYSANQVIGRHMSIHVPADRLHEVETILARVKRGERIDHYETVRVKKNGDLIDVSLTISPIFDQDARIVGASSIAHDITQRKVFEEKLQLQLRHMMALREIDRAITTSFDIRVTLNVFLDQVTSQLNADAAAVLLIDPHSHILEYAATRGFLHENISQTPLRMGEGFAGRAALERKLISVPDLTRAQDISGRLLSFIKEGFKSYFGVPLIAKGQCKGVLEVFHRESLTPNAEWLDFLQMLAGQAAIAIDSASLFNDLQKTNADLMLAYDTTLEGWSHALDLRDRETEGHTRRVTEKTMRLVRAMGIRDEELIHVRRGSLLHDIGKMGIPDSILLKPTALTIDEWKIMRQHPVYAYEMLAPIDYLKSAVDIPYCHHEKWDGRGYPRGLKGEQIPLAARAFSVVDVWDALRSDRPYRSGWSANQVWDHIRSETGRHFDPGVVSVFESLVSTGTI